MGEGKADKRIGNKFWMARSSHGPKPKFADGDALWAACVEYFEWVEANPLKQSELVKFQGEAKVAELPKMRAMTLKGLCRFLDVGFDTWVKWRERVDLSHIVTRVEEIIYEQKLTGAAADLLNPSIIARELGLADKSEVRATHKVSAQDLTDDQLSAIAAAGGTGASGSKG